MVVLCVTCVSVSLWSKFNIPKYRPLRFAVFVLFGSYGVIPLLHIIIREGLYMALYGYSILGMVVMGSLYLTGASLYVLRIPERFFPGWFDVWASSHQLFHICVVTAALVHYDSLLSMVKYRLKVGDCIERLDMLSV